MPRNNRSDLSRSDITNTADRLDQGYKEKTGELDRTKQDYEVEIVTIEGMGMLGTLEGMQAVVASLETARDTSVKEFEEQTDAFEGVKAEGQELEGELQERTESVTADLEKLGQARSEVNSRAAGSSVERAESQLQEDREFLSSEDKRERESREAAEELVRQLRQVVLGTGG
jgi:hypothetical protein